MSLTDTIRARAAQLNGPFIHMCWHPRSRCSQSEQASHGRQVSEHALRSLCSCIASPDVLVRRFHGPDTVVPETVPPDMVVGGLGVSVGVYTVCCVYITCVRGQTTCESASRTIKTRQSLSRGVCAHCCRLAKIDDQTVVSPALERCPC